METIVECRYNNNHRVKQSRLLIHEQKCPDKKCSKLIDCPYNPGHKISFLNIESHKKNCPDKPYIEESLKNEMQAYIQQMKFQQNRQITFQVNNNTNLTLNQTAVKKKRSDKKVFEKPKSSIKEEDIFSLGNENGVVEYNDDDDDLNIEEETIENGKENSVFNNVYQ